MIAPIKFYSGEADSIGRAFSDIESDDLQDGSAKAYADLSLHLAPDDLDTLSEVAAGLVGVAPSLLSECLIRQVGSLDDGQTGGAGVVDPKWPEMFAALGDEDAEPLTVEWFSRLGQKYGEPLELNREAIAGVKALIRLCTMAVAAGDDVVYVWYL
jgi:hypothetical protein